MSERGLGLDWTRVDPLIRLALDEDVGPGDLTTEALVEPGARGAACAAAKEPLIVAGVPVFGRVFELLDPRVKVTARKIEGEKADAGEVIAEAAGPLGSLLTGERVALNFLQRLSGIATLTRQFVDAVAGLPVRIADTRKTMPGWRELDKYAVRAGGGTNHRRGLYDGILVKDNHVDHAGGIAAAVARGRTVEARVATPLEVEVRTEAELDEALRAGAKRVLIDNFSIEGLREAIRRVAGRAETEASGGMSLATIRSFAETGVDIVSVGALTHSARAMDIHMKIVKS